MACTKPYGLRRVFIAKETNGVAGTFYELRVSNIEVPKVFAEHTVIDESTGLRGDTAFTEGNVNDLAGTITVTLPKSKANFINFTPIQTLFNCGGFSVATDSILPQNTGSCGNTFCLYTLDRTGLLAERLEGCIVTNIDFTLNKNDAPTVAFAYTAAKKIEMWSAPEDQLDLHNDSEEVTIYASEGFMVRTGINKSATFSAGELPISILEGSTVESGAYVSVLTVDDSGNYSITIVRPNAVDHTDYDVYVKPAIPAGAITLTGNSPAYCSNRGWSIHQGGSEIVSLKILSASLSIETGMSYGELVVGHDFKSEVLVGTLNASGSLTVYMETPSAYEFCFLNITPDEAFDITIGDYKIVMPRLVYSEPPDMALAKDQPISGDFAFKCYCGDEGTSSNPLTLNLISIVSA